MIESKTCKTCKQRVTANNFCNITGKITYMPNQEKWQWEKACEMYEEDER